MDKKLSLKLNGGRVVQGILRGFDPFMNVVVDESLEICKDGKKNEIGMVVSRAHCILSPIGNPKFFFLLGHPWKQHYHG
jgi:small nuclear ribonucleoprotein G